MLPIKPDKIIYLRQPCLFYTYWRRRPLCLVSKLIKYIVTVPKFILAAHALKLLKIISFTQLTIIDRIGCKDWLHLNRSLKMARRTLAPMEFLSGCKYCRRAYRTQSLCIACPQFSIGAVGGLARFAAYGRCAL